MRRAAQVSFCKIYTLPAPRNFQQFGSYGTVFKLKNVELL